MIETILLGLMLVSTAAVLAVALARMFRLPSLLAYLAVGVALGPHGLKLVEESDQVAHLAEFGVVFLMFSIGLEFSLGRLKSMRGLVFGQQIGDLSVIQLPVIQRHQPLSCKLLSCTE